MGFALSRMASWSLQLSCNFLCSKKDVRSEAASARSSNLLPDGVIWFEVRKATKPSLDRGAEVARLADREDLDPTSQRRVVAHHDGHARVWAISFDDEFVNRSRDVTEVIAIQSKHSSHSRFRPM
jgi:hypothetical protein